MFFKNSAKIPQVGRNLIKMDSNSVSPMPELAPMAEFDKTPPTPPEEPLPMDDLPPPPTTVSVPDEKQDEKWV